jgi:hypothetical protein
VHPTQLDRGVSRENFGKKALVDPGPDPDIGRWPYMKFCLSVIRKKRAKGYRDINAIGHRVIGYPYGHGNWYSLDKEKEIGTQVSAAFEKSTTLLHDSTTQAYLDRLAQTITRNSDSQLPITIRVIDSDSSYVIRAVTNMTPFTCPSGVNFGVPNGRENATMRAGSFSCGFSAERAW